MEINTVHHFVDPDPVEILPRGKANEQPGGGVWLGGYGEEGNYVFGNVNFSLLQLMKYLVRIYETKMFSDTLLNSIFIRG